MPDHFTTGFSRRLNKEAVPNIPDIQGLVYGENHNHNGCDQDQKGEDGHRRPELLRARVQVSRGDEGWNEGVSYQEGEG